MIVTDSEKAVLNEIYQTSRENLSAIHTILGKVYDEELALDLTRQAASLSALQEKAAGRLFEQGTRPQSVPPVLRAKNWTGLQASTLLNTSTNHVARLMIRKNTQSMTDMMKTVKHNPAASKWSCELAEELMDFEEKSIRKLRAYLKH